MADFCPGEWFARKTSVFANYGGGKSHKVADTRQPLFTVECQHANALLMAAAPAMLAALQQAESFIAGFEDDELQEGIPEMLAGIRAAIAAATGAPTSEAAPALSLDNMGREFTCTACGREESECSAEPCAAVIADRES